MTRFSLQVFLTGFDEYCFLFLVVSGVFEADVVKQQLQRATSGGRWPFKIDLFTMVGLIA